MTRTAKKTAAKTTAAKPATGTSRKRAPRKTTTAALALVKDDTATVVDLRHPLPVRRRHFVGTHTKPQIIEARAALASAMAALPVPHILWLAQPDGRAAARLTDGTHLIHTHQRAPEFTALLRCPTGGLHAEHVTNTADLTAARAVTATCTRRHDDTDPAAGGYDWHKAITLGVQKITPTRLSPLNAGLKTAKKATEDTQSMSLDEIGAHIADQLAADTSKEGD
ncbi:hypothetical protein [Streptomyces chartreusis]|uniref:hypothetical protein n=1 Tax=Streptomyces chartreusis TaxID=1969 RepID=UPI0037DDE291|nr:hypothetical protein OG938_48490 [Streptomyces chartreusis]